MSSTLDRAQALSARVGGDGGKSPAAPCGATLHIGFFFDGFARNLEQDLQTNRLSNIGRLFLAHPNDLDASTASFKQFKRFYISGLGAPFDPTLGEAGAALSGAGLRGAASKAQDTLEGLPEDTAIGAGIEAGQDILTGTKKWFERLLNNLKPSNILAEAIKGTAISGLEGVEIIRDNETVAELFKTGVDTRLEAALQRFQRKISETLNTSEIPLRRIAVSVFGFDFGATLARAFCHKLFDECEPGSGLYQGVKLEVVFAGLFDAVDRSMESSIVWETLAPIANQVDDGEGLHGSVKAALHLIAAHECRDTRRARLIGTGPSTPRWEERLVPGISEDVGGGLNVDASTHSGELHLACLHDMYQAAYRAGVPFYRFEELVEHDADVAELFVLNDHINGVSAIGASERYMQCATASQPSAENFRAHRQLYIRWLSLQWRMYRGQYAAFEEEEQRLERPILGEQGSIARYLGLGSETAEQYAIRDRALAQVREDKSRLRNNFGWLEKVDEEAQRMRAGFYPTMETQLLEAWFSQQPDALGFDIEDLFELFLHDRYMVSQIHSANMSLKYFLVRGFDKPSQLQSGMVLPDPLEHLLPEQPATQQRC